jgi:8-oxo-dGTP pyrophosphatase MutT (NUDIX family)
MMMAVDPRPAATVIVAREAPSGIEVLMVRRSSISRFAPGVVVFPGGVVDDQDAELARAWFGSADHAPAACALRELAEETGLVLTRSGLMGAPGTMPGAPGLPAPALDQIREIARWVAPEFLPVRFDARFFALSSDRDLDPTPDGVETDRAWWTKPAEVLASREAGATPLLWPTLKMLEALAACRTVGEVFALHVEQVAPPVKQS